MEVCTIPPTWFCTLKAWTPDPILVFATLLLGSVTFFLFRSTRRVSQETGDLAKETRKLAAETTDLAKSSVAAAKQADIHHQRGLTPIIWFQGRLTTNAAPTVRSNREFHFTGSCKNIGPGPALGFEFFITPIGWVERRIEAGSLVSAEELPIDRIWELSESNQNSDPRLGNRPYSVRIDYQDAFGRKLTTTGQSPSGLSDDLTWNFPIFKPL